MFHRTPRLLLRPLWPEDADTLALLVGDWDVASRVARVPFPYRLGDARQFIAAVGGNPSLPVFGIQAHGLPAAPLIGCIGFEPGAAGAHDLGYWIGTRWWGRGFATEAVTAALEIAFLGLGLPRLDAAHFEDNPASARVLAKVGFVPAGHTAVFSRARGRALSARQMVLTRAAWLDRHPNLDLRAAA